MALPRQAAQTAAPGATSALRKPEPEPSRGRRRCGSSRRFPGRVGITERGVLMPRTQPAPHGAHGVPSPCQGSAGWLWGRWHGRSLLPVQGQAHAGSAETGTGRGGGAGWGVQMKPDPNPAQTELCTIPVP